MNSVLGILAGDVGFNILYLVVLFAAATGITIIGAFALFWSTRHPDEEDKHSLGKYESHWTIIIIIIFALFSVSTLPFLPYPYAHSDIRPDLTVDVQGQQFAWCLSPEGSWGPPSCVQTFLIPSGDTVLFLVRSTDVTHGFGVYQYNPNGTNPYGQILFQVQVMPNYTNSVLYRFTVPGTYYIRCLEFCGYGHYTMIGQFNVTSTRAVGY